MRLNVYAEELPEAGDPRAVELREVEVSGGRRFRGIRLYLKSATELHDTPDDDDRSAVTIWGPRHKVAALLRQMADEIERLCG